VGKPEDFQLGSQIRLQNGFRINGETSNDIHETWRGQMVSTKNHVLLHLAPQLPIAYNPTLQTRRITANTLLIIFMTAVNDIHDWCNHLPSCLAQVYSPHCRVR